MKEILSVNSQHANGKRKYSCEKKIRWAGPSQRRREQGRGSGLKNVLRKLLRIPYRRLKGGFFCVGSCECWLCLFVCHWESSEWNAQGERLLLKKPFILCGFRHLKITLDLEQPMWKEKRIIPSVWGGIKSFEHLQRGEYFSDCSFDLFVSRFRLLFAGLN